MSLGEDLQSDVAALLDDPDFGRVITIQKAAPGTYDPGTGGITAATPATATTRGLLLGYRDTVIDGSLIKQGDRKCLVKVKNLTVTPEVGDRVTVGTDTYAVISIKTVELGGVVILYTLQIRK